MEKLIREGVALAYTEAGRGAPPMLFVHCWCCDHTFMEAQFAHFGRAHRVVSVDLRGHGESDKPEQDYTVAGFADDLAWLCDRLGLTRPVVVGHSMGGNVAFELSRRHPDLPAAVVAVDSAITPPPWLRQAAAKHAADLRGPDFEGTQRRFVDGFFLPTDDPRIKERVLDGMASLSPPRAAVSSLEDHILVWDGGAAAAACTVPALLITAATPLSDLDALRHAVPRLVVGQTVGAGHFNNRLVPDQVNAMIDRFLEVALVPAASLAVAAGGV